MLVVDGASSYSSRRELGSTPKTTSLLGVFPKISRIWSKIALVIRPMFLNTNTCTGFRTVIDPPQQRYDRKMQKCKIAPTEKTAPYDFLNEKGY
jgi:hypothetical protein